LVPEWNYAKERLFFPFRALPNKEIPPFFWLKESFPKAIPNWPWEFNGLGLVKNGYQPGCVLQGPRVTQAPIFQTRTGNLSWEKGPPQKFRNGTRSGIFPQTRF